MDEKLDKHGEQLAGINQHLKDLNGKVSEHEKSLNYSCPIKHEKLRADLNEIDKNIDKIFTVKNIISIILIMGVQIITFIVMFMKFTGGI